MGKKIRGAALRAKKRADAAQGELTEQTARQVETRGIAERPNEQLFVLDTTAKSVPNIPNYNTTSSKKKQKIIKQDKGILEKEKRSMQALTGAHDKKRKRLGRGTRTNYDLWQDEGTEDMAATDKTDLARQKESIESSLAGIVPSSHVQTKAQPVTRKPKGATIISVDVAHSGQSYHPDPQTHQDIIGEALAMELRRKEAQSYKDAPLSKGLKDETRSLLVGDESSEDEDEEGVHAQEDKEATITKKPKKLTRAQRNKQKRIRAEEKAIQERKRAKKAMNAVHDLKRIQKELQQKEQDHKERKEWIAKVKEQDQRALGADVFQQRSRVDPIGAPTLPVALTEELQSSLRLIKPKGSLLTERMESYRDRKMADQKHVGDRKQIVQGNKRRRVKVKAKGHDVNVTDESGRDYLLMG